MLASSKQKSEFLLYHSSQLATLGLILTRNTIVLNINELNLLILSCDRMS